MSWNGYGLSWWRCQCGAARRQPARVLVRGDGQVRYEDYQPCKRCGSVAEPVCIGDPWLCFEEVPV